MRGCFGVVGGGAWVGGSPRPRFWAARRRAAQTMTVVCARRATHAPNPHPPPPLPPQVVIFRDGKYLTLAEVFESLRLTSHELNVDALDMHADKNTFHRWVFSFLVWRCGVASRRRRAVGAPRRFLCVFVVAAARPWVAFHPPPRPPLHRSSFDRFNLKYNPFGQSRLREVFIKQDNLLRGRWLAELTAEVFADLEASKYQVGEGRGGVAWCGREEKENTKKQNQPPPPFLSTPSTACPSTAANGSSGTRWPRGCARTGSTRTTWRG